MLGMHMHTLICTAACPCIHMYTHMHIPMHMHRHRHMHMHAMMVCHVPRLAGGNNCRLWVTQPLMAGMIVSNEPGYYEDNAFGICIENLLHIREADTPFKFGDQSYFGFERLTMIPIQRKRILTDVSQCCRHCLCQKHVQGGSCASICSCTSCDLSLCLLFCPFAFFCLAEPSRNILSIAIIAQAGMCISCKTTETGPVAGAVKEGD